MSDAELVELGRPYAKAGITPIRPLDADLEVTEKPLKAGLA